MICCMSIKPSIRRRAIKIQFYMGDVRDMHGVDYIFHAAALKQVPSCEFFHIEVVKQMTNKECVYAIDMGNFCRALADKRELNYDKYFKDGDEKRNPLTECNSSDTDLLDVEQVKAKLLTLQYIRDELSEV